MTTKPHEVLTDDRCHEFISSMGPHDLVFNQWNKRIGAARKLRAVFTLLQFTMFSLSHDKQASQSHLFFVSEFYREKKKETFRLNNSQISLKGAVL